MSFFNKVLGKKKEKTPTLPQAILQVKDAEDTLLKKQSYLESKIEKELAIAKQNASKNKKVALHALQRKKRYERQLQQVDGTLTTLEGQREVLENANLNKVAITSMKKGSEALKKAHEGLDTGVVEKVIDDLADQREVVDEISEAISKPVALGDSFDEEELERELEELTASLEELSMDTELPSVPQGDIKEKSIEKKKQALEAI